MQEASNITCWNRGGFIQKFQVKWTDAAGITQAGGWTDLYPNPESKSFDLNQLNIPEGGEVWVEVNASMGATKEATEKVNFKRGCGKTANYSVTGTTLIFYIKLAPDRASNKISCQNHGGFKMKFRVEWDGGSSGYSEYFFNPSIQTIDLDSLNIPEGAEAWIFVDVLWGGSKTASEHVVYQKGCDVTAKYEVLGTTYHLTINRVG